jgi:hypothetical protein
MLQSPFLRTSRSFPPDLTKMSVEINKAYIDIANAVNSRVSGLFPTNKPIVTGEAWYFDRNRKQQGSRQVYTFTTSPTTILHGINFDLMPTFTRMYGMYTDGINWYGLIPGSNLPIVNQVSFYLDPLNIVIIQSGAPPMVQNGILVLEWLSDV